MLLLDAGNSRCKWAWTDHSHWLQQGVLNNTDRMAWQQLRETFARRTAPPKILASNVAGAAGAQRLRELCSTWTLPVEIIVAQAAQCGVRNSYEQAAQLGSDRWAALIAAWQHTGQACLVVNCGTATTVDALSATGTFLGGLILPGIELMKQSLLDNTAQLSLGNSALGDFPRNTADAIASGAMQATIGAIQRQYSLLSTQGKTRCIVSGGAANLILPKLGLAAVQMDNLVLQGLEIIGQGCSAMTQKDTVA